MAGLPFCNAWVKVGPPLFCREANLGSLFIKSLVLVKPQVFVSSRLYPFEVMLAGLQQLLSPLWAMMLFFTDRVPLTLLQYPSVPLVDELLVIVVESMVLAPKP